MSVSKSSVSNKTKRKYRKGNGPFTIVMTFAFILKQTNKKKYLGACELTWSFYNYLSQQNTGEQQDTNLIKPF